jgi:branched-chain amino acid transport system ATP-binding protein
MPLVRTERLTKAFGALTAVNEVTLQVEEGVLHSVIGPNGAGKTTFFNLLTGQLQPTSGRIIFDGRDIAGLSPHEIARLGIARSFQRTSIFPTLSILDNVWLAAFARQEAWRGLAWRRADSYPELARRALGVLEEVGLGEKASQQARAISHGEQRQLELAIALAATPRLLLLDEPAAGLSPDETQKMVTLVRKLKGRYAVILIEHKIDVVMTMSDRISVMHFGSVIAEGTPAEIQRNADVRRAYLGGIAGVA